MKVNRKEFLDSQIAMANMIVEDFRNLGADEPVFAIKLDIDDIRDGLIVNYWYAKNPDVDDYFPEEANEWLEEHEEWLEEHEEWLEEHEEWLGTLDALTKQKPEAVVAMTLSELSEEVRKQFQYYQAKRIY